MFFTRSLSDTILKAHLYRGKHNFKIHVSCRNSEEAGAEFLKIVYVKKVTEN